jgi:hypothetical protein
MQGKWITGVAVGLMALGLGASTAASSSRVVDLSGLKAAKQLKAVGASAKNQNCPVHGRMPQQGESGAILDTGLVTLGVVDAGNLIWDDTGLYLDWNYNDVLTPGCPCESWGVADSISGVYGDAGSSWGYDNIYVDSFTSTPTSAVSKVYVYNPSNEHNVFYVTHDFHPSLTNFLFECTVSIQNVSGAATEVRYRRAIDWDMTPTAYNELVTVKRNGATKVTFTSDNGFANPNPLSGPTQILFQGDAVDSGPYDHGCLFDLDLGMLAANQTKTFTFYIGVAPDEFQAMAALAQVGAEAYSLGRPDPYGGGGGIGAPVRPNSVDFDAIYPGGTPNSAVFGLKGVGGRRVVAPSSFIDDYNRSQLCVAWDPGFYQWTMLTGNGSYAVYDGLGQVLNGNGKIVNFPGDLVTLNFTYSILQKKANGYFIDPFKNYSPLFDKLTTDDPPCGSGGQPTLPRR